LKTSTKPTAANTGRGSEAERFKKLVQATASIDLTKTIPKA